MFPLVLDTKWLAMAKAKEPLVLRNVYVSNQLVPVTQVAEIAVKSLSKISPVHLNAKVTEIDDDMRWGRRPAHLQCVAPPSFFLFLF